MGGRRNGLGGSGRGRPSTSRSAAEQAAYPSSLLHHLSRPTCFFHGGADGWGGRGGEAWRGSGKKVYKLLGFCSCQRGLRKREDRRWLTRPLQRSHMRLSSVSPTLCGGVVVVATVCSKEAKHQIYVSWKPKPEGMASCFPHILVDFSLHT